jgi:palmitoyl-protein thioesterase
MDDSVDAFAAGVAADSNLQKGFHAIGFSQGNNIIRGYIAKVNSPAVHTFISVNGVNAGIGAVPYCQPDVLPAQSSAHATINVDDRPPVRISLACAICMEQASRRPTRNFQRVLSPITILNRGSQRVPNPVNWLSEIMNKMLLAAT